MKEHNPFKTITIGFISVWLIIFALIPNIMVFLVSFAEHNEASFIVPHFTAANYASFLNSSYFYIFAESIKIAAITTIICLIIGYPFAFILAKSNSRYKNLLALFVIIPYWTSSLIRTYAIRVILTTNGVINTALIKLGIIDAPLDLLYTQGAVILGLTYTLLPFMILPLYAAIDKFDYSLIEAAQDLGASRFQTFARVIIPITLPGIIAGSLLVFLPSLGLFYVADILGGSKNLLIGNLIKDAFLRFGNWPFGAAASNMLLIAMALLLFIYYKSVRTMNRRVL